jgi:hypothetical protein
LEKGNTVNKRELIHGKEQRTPKQVGREKAETGRIQLIIKIQLISYLESATAYLRHLTTAIS